MKLVQGLGALDALALGAQSSAASGGAIERCSAVLVGVFDGVHLGHQRLLHELLELASSTGSLPTVVTFANHPATVLHGRPAEWIVGLEHRLRLLRRAGVMRAVLLQFDDELRQMSAAEFTQRILVRGLATRGLLLGYDAAIGRDREGTFERMQTLGADHGFAVREGSVFEVDGKPVSSTAIRAAIQVGDLDLANRMLGRWPSVLGRVVRGAGRGRSLGFPTANLDLADTVVPPTGVYAVEVLHDGSAFAGVANFGARPTVDTDEAPLLEVHVFDFDEDLYGATLEVAFVSHIRDQHKFDNLEALRAQIAEDAAIARDRLQGVGPATQSVPIFHLARAAEWQRARDSGVYRGSDADRADGFLHFSTADQIVESAARHRAGEPDLVLLRVEASTLGDALRWEASRGGAVFPHLYGDLPVRVVDTATPLQLDASGVHVFPAGSR